MPGAALSRDDGNLEKGRRESAGHGPGRNFPVAFRYVSRLEDASAKKSASRPQAHSREIRESVLIYNLCIVVLVLLLWFAAESIEDDKTRAIVSILVGTIGLCWLIVRSGLISI